MRRSMVFLIALVLVIGLITPAVARTSQTGIIKLQDKDLVPVTELTKTNVDSGKVWASKDLIYFHGRYYLPLDQALQLLGGSVYWDGQKWVISQPNEKLDPLNYYLSFDYEKKELVLTVYNPHPYAVKLTFNTSKTHDMVITRNGQKVWQLSDDQQYTQIWHQETLDPWSVKNYRTALPQLPPGVFEAHALFSGGQTKEVVANTTFYNLGPVTDFSKLSYSMWYQPGNWNNPAKIVLSTTNTGDKPVTQYFWSDQTFDLVIKNNNGIVWRFSDGKESNSGFNTRTISAGGISTKYIYPPGLQPGRYVAEAYDYSVSEDWPVATMIFYVR